ncbi:MAG: acetyl-CoA carboxylase biotin carboxyl carrier protein [Gemmatimonadales bacterium]
MPPAAGAAGGGGGPRGGPPPPGRGGGMGAAGGGGGGHIVVTQAPLAQVGEGGRGAGDAVASAPKTSLLEIKSPMVGTFYQSPEPAAQPYVKVGSRVNVGQVVCIIEAMKIMNEIESEVTGVVKEVTAQNAQPVEFGQVLFRVDPHG